MIAKLEQHWPGVKLSVGSHNNPNTDTRLLCSPLLHSLSFCILNHTATVVATDQLGQYSKLPELREVLLRSPNLRKLDIKFEYNWMGRRVHWSGITAEPHVLNLPLQPSDRLPPLRELTFSGPPETYEFDLKHCRLWKQCMDWSQLRRLDLGISCPQNFFEVFGGNLPSLKALTMGMRVGDRNYTHWPYGPLTCDNPSRIKNFIQSLPPLLELNLTDLDLLVELFNFEIPGYHRSLRKLYYHASINRSDRSRHYTWSESHLLALRDRCRDITDLTIDLPLVKGTLSREHVRAVTLFDRLDTLKVFVELNYRASDFSPQYYRDVDGSGPMPPLDLKVARGAAVFLFKSFFVNNPYAHLRSLEICFLRQRLEDRGQKFDNENSIKITRLERDDAPGPLDGGYIIEGSGNWVDHDGRTQQVV
ncbi:MAG: hypothetical protein Q9224_002865 [Gallowayella concinna]